MLSHDHQRFNESVTATDHVRPLCEVEHRRPTDEHLGPPRPDSSLFFEQSDGIFRPTWHRA